MKISITFPGGSAGGLDWPFAFAPTVGMKIQFQDASKNHMSGTITDVGASLIYGTIYVTVKPD